MRFSWPSDFEFFTMKDADLWKISSGFKVTRYYGLLITHMFTSGKVRSELRPQSVQISPCLKKMLPLDKFYAKFGVNFAKFCCKNKYIFDASKRISVHPNARHILFVRIGSRWPKCLSVMKSREDPWTHCFKGTHAKCCLDNLFYSTKRNSRIPTLSRSALCFYAAKNQHLYGC